MRSGKIILSYAASAALALSIVGTASAMGVNVGIGGVGVSASNVGGGVPGVGISGLPSGSGLPIAPGGHNGLPKVPVSASAPSFAASKNPGIPNGSEPSADSIAKAGTATALGDKGTATGAHALPSANQLKTALQSSGGGGSPVPSSATKVGVPNGSEPSAASVAKAAGATASGDAKQGHGLPSSPEVKSAASNTKVPKG